MVSSSGSAYSARLYNHYKHGVPAAWWPQANDADSWLEFYLTIGHYLTGVVTQGDLGLKWTTTAQFQFMYYERPWTGVSHVCDNCHGSLSICKVSFAYAKFHLHAWHTLIACLCNSFEKVRK